MVLPLKEVNIGRSVSQEKTGYGYNSYTIGGNRAALSNLLPNI
jgi:hypothetical protein